MRNKLIKFEKKVTFALQTLGGIFIVIGTFLIFISATGRYVMGRSPMWTEEACRMLILACSFWLMGHMEFSNGQVCLSILVEHVKNKTVLKVIQFIKFCLVAVLAGLCLYWGLLQFIASKGQKTFTQVYPRQLPASIIPIGMAILLIYCVMKIYLLITEKQEMEDAVEEK